MRCQMMRVISSPSISTTGLRTLIFAIGDLCGEGPADAAVGGLMARPARSCKDKTYAGQRHEALVFGQRPALQHAAIGARTWYYLGAGALSARMRRSESKNMRTWRDIRGAYGRGRRALRRAL